MTLEHAKDLLAAHGQQHVLRFWDTLDGAARASLLAQIGTLDFAAIARMRDMLLGAASDEPRAEPRAPDVTVLSGAERAAALEAGGAAFRAGSVAVLPVAGGQGSRLGYEGPKGAYAIGPITGQSLFYFHARKVAGLSRRYGVRVPFYIMTSAANDAETRAHFEANGHFGLDAADVIFFRQGVWPALDEEGRIILDAPGHIFMNPDGHGGTITALEASGCLADMEARGIASVFYFQVDNPMVEVADPAFIGLHAMRGADVSLKVCAKRGSDEKMGVVVTRGGHTEIVEYTEMTPEMAHRRTADGGLYFNYGSVAIHVFSAAFLRRVAARPMPLHIAHKKIPVCGADGATVKPAANNGYKFEKLIFDVLPNARNVVSLAFDRADEFSPVKNPDGDDSPATCQRDLQAKWRRQLAAAGVLISEDATVEVDPGGEWGTGIRD